MSKARNILGGASWLYGAQIGTVAIQFFYAALSSRLVGAHDFGAYAAALAVVGLASLLAMGGLGQTVARMESLHIRSVRALVTYATLLGLAAAAFLLLSGPFWAWLWGAEAMTGPLLWLTINALISPLLGLALGLAGRLGKFRAIALISFFGNIGGMGIGAVAVSHWQSAASLTASTIVGQLITLICLMLFATENLLLGFGSLRNQVAIMEFSRRVTGTSLLSYVTGNLVKLSLARGLESSALGQLNRAEVLTTVPMQQMQSAVIKSIYPEFRHDINNASRARRVWTDMMILVTWASLTVSALLYVSVPPLVPMLFGDGWDVASQLVGPLAIAGGLQIMSTLLATALEALARFRWILSIELTLILLQIVGVAAVISSHEVLVAAYFLILTGLLRHAIQIHLLNGAGYLDVQRLMKNYAVAAIFASTTAGVFHISLVVLQSSSSPALRTSVVAGLVLGFAGITFLMKERLPVVRILRSYGIL